MSKEALQSNIENYLLGKLPSPARLEFEAAMEADPGFSEQVQQRRSEWEAQELLAENLLRAQIRQRLEAHPVERKTGGKNRWIWWVGGLAGVALLAWLLFPRPVEKASLPPAPVLPPAQDTSAPAPIAAPEDSIRQTSPPPPSQSPAKSKKDQPDYRQLALATYQLPEQLAEVRGTAAPGDTLALAQEAFAKKEYRQVARLLSKLPLASTQEALLLRAHAHFLSGNYASAKSDFDALIKGGIYRRDAEWFGLLSAMATSVSVERQWRQQLSAIRSDDRHPWQEKAETLWQAVGSNQDLRFKESDH